MAWSWGDGFDLYAAVADAGNGYWDTVTVGGLSLVAGRFTGSQAVQQSTTGSFLKTSGVNDAVHHIVLAFRQTAAITGTTLGTWLAFYDGATVQCSVVFRSDGAILLTSGVPTGTVIATYTGAFPVTNTWYAFEIEVNISNTAGFMNVRKNGNTSNDFSSATNLNTRTSANNYANRFQFGMQAAISQQQVDDLYWQSGASSGVWLGDIRCYTRLPASDQSVQFSRVGTASQTFPAATNSTVSITNTVARFTPFTPTYSGPVTSVSVVVGTGNSGNAKCTIFADNGSGAPGAVIASAVAPITPLNVGANVFTFSPGATVARGAQIWVGFISDTSTGNWSDNNTVTTSVTQTTTYAAFPASNPVVSTVQPTVQVQITYGSTSNWPSVAEAQQDATTSYVYDSTPGDQDFYGIAAIASTPVATYAVTTRAYMEKSDAGTRTAAVQLKSGAATVASTTLVLTTSGWLWAWRTDTVDPNTSAAWTPVAVNNAQVGPKVIA